MLSIFNSDELLEIFKYIIFEIKILVFGTNINDICIFINGLLKIIYPFHYNFQVNSLVPNNAYDVLESISPYIFGINAKYSESFFSDNKISCSDDLMILGYRGREIGQILDDLYEQILRDEIKNDHEELMKATLKGSK